MEEELKLFLEYMALTQGMEELETVLPLSQPRMRHIQWTPNWHAQLTHHLQTLAPLQRTPSQQLALSTVLCRLNFTLQSVGKGRLQL